jgi:beta-galactosidase
VLATYQDDFYAQSPSVTKHAFGTGEAYYIGARTKGDFLGAFYGSLIDSLDLANPWVEKSNPSISVQQRGENHYFVMNFSEESHEIMVASEGVDLLKNESTLQHIQLAPYEVKVIRTNAE